MEEGEGGTGKHRAKKTTRASGSSKMGNHDCGRRNALILASGNVLPEQTYYVFL